VALPYPGDHPEILLEKGRALGEAVTTTKTLTETPCLLETLENETGTSVTETTEVHLVVDTCRITVTGITHQLGTLTGLRPAGMITGDGTMAAAALGGCLPAVRMEVALLTVLAEITAVVSVAIWILRVAAVTKVVIQGTMIQAEVVMTLILAGPEDTK